MEWDDIIYLSLLFSSIGFGKILRMIECSHMRKNAATFVGLLIILVVSGVHVIHPLIFTLVNAIIITSFSYKFIHKLCFFFSFSYLIFFRSTWYFGIPYPPPHTNLVIMMLALKMIGLSFEVHDSQKSAMHSDSSSNKRTIIKPSFLDVFHYAFSYLGVLTGPYYTYRMYCDLYVTPFWKYVSCESITLERFKYLPVYAILFAAFSYYFPFSFTQTESFYSNTSVWFRLWYIWPLFAQFRMRMYIGMRLSECVLTMAGLGAYPEICEPKPTAGPTKNLDEIANLAASEDKAKLVKYNLVAAFNIEPYNCEFDVTVRSAMKAWNISVQFWLAEYVYRRFPIKAYRTLLVFFVSALWHGVYAGYYLTICSVPFYLPVEDIYRRHLKDLQLPSMVSAIGKIVAAQWRIYLMAYWAVTFRLLTLRDSIRYWSSIYFIPTLITVSLYGVALIIFRKVKGPSKNKKVD